VRALVASGDASAPVTFADVPEPDPAPGEAVVAVEALSLNRGECRRLTQSPAGTRSGWDVAGTVVRAAADGSGPPEGARVVGLATEGWGERAAVPANRLSALPDGLSASLAATLPVAGMTALLALRRGGQLLGKRVAVTGATGGVGVFALQLAARSGARTTAIVSAPDRTAGLPSRGVDEVSAGFGQARFDVILDSVGGPLLADALAAVEPGGIVVTYGGSSAEPTTFPPMSFYPRNRATLSAFMLFSELDADPPGGRHLATLADLVVAGDLDVPIDVEESWEQAPRVVRALLDRQVRGKAVLRVG
jgi:NADPH:quinone reductase-like Zn-dependent oxidoreductase